MSDVAESYANLIGGADVKPGEKFVGSPVYPDFNFLEPDYAAILKDRNQLLIDMASRPGFVNELKKLYRTEGPLLFMRHWAVCWEPRSMGDGDQLTVLGRIPMVLFRRQEEMVDWVYEVIKNGGRVAVDKSRDCGASWIIVWICLWLLLFVPDTSAGYGHMKKEYVDQTHGEKAFFQRLLFAITCVPSELLPLGWDNRRRNPPTYASRRIRNDDIGTSITGEAGDEVGRGDRKTFYFLDEAAKIPHLRRVHASLSATTTALFNVSTAAGAGNYFSTIKQEYRKQDSSRVFVFDFTDDPRKPEGWEEELRKELADDAIFDQEYGRDDYVDDLEVFIPFKWLRSCIDAHKVLGFNPSGIRVTGYDPADRVDDKSVVHRHGSVVTEAKRTKYGDLEGANAWACREADQRRSQVFIYDGDGLGVEVGKFATKYFAYNQHMSIQAFHGSGKVKRPNAAAFPRENRKMEREDWEDSRTNVEYWENRKGQAMGNLRNKVRRTHELVKAKTETGRIIPYREDEVISFAKECEELDIMLQELATPREVWSGNAKRGVESKRQMRSRGIPSTNVGDACLYCVDSESETEYKKRLEKKSRWRRKSRPVRFTMDY